MPVRYACTCESTHLRMKCYLSILARGDCIEVSFNDGDPPGGAESQRICEEGMERNRRKEKTAYQRSLLEG